MSRQGDYCIISVLRVLTMQTYRLSLDMDIADSEIGHLTRADEEIVDDFASQQIVLVVLQQVVSDELHGTIRYDISVFLLSVLYASQSFSWIFWDIAASQQVGGKTLSPGKIVVAGQNCVVSVDEYIVQELAHITSVPLIGEVEDYVFLLLPSLQDSDTTAIVNKSLLTHATLVAHLDEISLIFLEYIFPLRIFQRLQSLNPWVPASHELLGETLHNLVGIDTLITLALDMVKHDFLLPHAVELRIKRHEGDITFRSLVKNWRFPANDTAKYSVIRIWSIIFFSHIFNFSQIQLIINNVYKGLKPTLYRPL